MSPYQELYRRNIEGGLYLIFGILSKNIVFSPLCDLHNNKVCGIWPCSSS